jgi:hypothetical protein
MPSPDMYAAAALVAGIIVTRIDLLWWIRR